MSQWFVWLYAVPKVINGLFQAIKWLLRMLAPSESQDRTTAELSEKLKGHFWHIRKVGEGQDTVIFRAKRRLGGRYRAIKCYHKAPDWEHEYDGLTYLQENRVKGNLHCCLEVFEKKTSPDRVETEYFGGHTLAECFQRRKEEQYVCPYDCLMWRKLLPV